MFNKDKDNNNKYRTRFKKRQIFNRQLNIEINEKMGITRTIFKNYQELQYFISHI